VNLGRGLDQILQVRPRKEIAQRHELAVRLILNVHHTPTISPCAHGFTTNYHFPFGTNHGEWDHFPNVFIELHFLVIVIVSIKRIETNVLVGEFPPNL